MAERTVSVALKADVSDYTAKLAKAAAATRQLGDANVKVDADTAGASAKLSSVGNEVKRLDGKTARIKVDVNDTGATQRAAQNISTLMSAAIATSPALIGIGAAAAAGIGAIAPLAASAGAGLGVLALGFSGVGDAVKLLQQRHDAETAASTKSAASQVASTQQIASAQASLANARANAAASAVSAAESVAKAVQSEKEAERSAAQGVADAQTSAIKGVRSALDQQEQAEKDLTSAQRTARQAQDDLTSARKTAQQQIEDTANSVADNAIAQRQAVLDLKDAQTALDKARATGNADDIARAQIAYDSQIQRQKELVIQGKRLGDQQAENARTGVEGSTLVVAAQQKLVDANQKVADADRDARNAAEQVDEARTDGAIKVGKAQEDGARKIADAQQAVADAARAQAEQQRQSAYSIQQAQAAVQAAMSATANQSQSSLDLIDAKIGDVGASTLSFAKYVDSDLKPAFKRLQDVAAAGLLPGVQAGLDDLLKQEPRITGFVSTFSKALGGLAEDSLKRLSDPQWSKFFDTLERQGVPQLQAMWHTGDNVAEAFASILTAFEPMATSLARGIEGLSADFATWSANLGQSQGFHQFQAYVQENWPKIQAIIANVADVVQHLIEAGAPIGSELLSGFKLLSDVLSTLPVSVVQTLLEVFLGYKAVQSVVGTVTGVANSFLALKGNVEGLPEKLGGVSSFLTGPWGLAIGGATLGLTVLTGWLDKSGQASDQAKDAQHGLASALRDSKGALDENVRSAAAKAAQDAGLLGMAQTLGISLPDVTDAVLGNADALDRVTGAANGYIDASMSYEHAGDPQWTKNAEGAKAFLDGLNVLAPTVKDNAAQQGQLAAANGVVTKSYDEQSNAISNFASAASAQFGIYSKLLADKTTKEQEAAQATAIANGSSTASVQGNVAAAHVSLDEYAAALDADVAKKDAWREDIKKVTERGGEEVGAALLAMGQQGAQIADDLANASDADFKRMADSMVNNARNGGAAAAWEMDQAMKIMTLKSRDGAALTAQGIADELKIGVEDASRIAHDYGIALAVGLEPVSVAVGMKPITITADMRASNPFYANRAQGGVIDYYANGGVESHVAEIAPAGQWRVWAEPETGGEAYIPLAPSKRDRSLDIWRETGKRLGVDVQQFANGGLVALGRRLQGMGASVTGNSAFGGVELGQHGKTSLHYTDDALDVNTRPGTSALEQQELAPMAALARSLGFRTIFMAPDHYNHLHIDDGAGASIGAAGAAPVVLPKPPSTAPYGPPISTAADGVMQKAYNDATAFLAANGSSGDAGSYGGGSMRELGRQIAASMGFGNQFSAIDSVFTRESGWNPNAQNPTSSAYGIPQFLNSTWAQYGGKTSVPSAQISDGIQYMVDRYGSPNAANAFWNAHHWYEKGTNYVPSDQLAVLHKGEAVVPATQNQGAPYVGREFSGASGGSFAGGGAATVNIEGATITGTLEIGGDGLARIVNGQITSAVTNVNRGLAARGVR